MSAMQRGTCGLPDLPEGGDAGNGVSLIMSLVAQLRVNAQAAVDTCFVIGVGAGADLPALRQLNATRLILAEGHPETAQALALRVDDRRGEQLWATAVATDCSDHVGLHVQNFWRYNAIPPPSGLPSYLPNVRMTSKISVPCAAIAESVRKLDLDPAGVHVLVLDAPGQAFDLIDALPAAMLQHFSWIAVRSSHEALYEGEATADSLIELLRNRGFGDVAEAADALFPERAIVFARDAGLVEKYRLAAELEVVRAEQARVACLADELQARLSDEQTAGASKEQQLSALRLEVGELSRERDGLISTLESKVAELKDVVAFNASHQQTLGELRSQSAEALSRLSAMEGRLTDATTEIGAFKAGIAGLGSDSSKALKKMKSIERNQTGVATAVASARETMNALRTESSDVLQSLDRLGDSLVNIETNGQEVQKQAIKSIYRRIDSATIIAAKQVEAYIGVHTYLAGGELPSLSTESHAWPISPDFALYLIELIDCNRYDMIMEFGSGYSTVLIAKALARGAPDHPVVQVAFEHLENYRDQTQAQLDHAGVSPAVELFLAPLEPYVAPNGNSYPYYNCNDVIKGLARRRRDENPRILVVVDGPPGKTGRHARYPALPVVLEHFAGSRIDFLLDDYGRPDEKEVVELWQEELSQAGIRHHAIVRRLEKDACLLRVNVERWLQHGLCVPTAL